MVWGTVTSASRSTLIVIRGILTGQRYVDDILRPHMGPFLNGLPVTILQQDNARPHTSRVTQDFLRHVQTLPWPSRSPDLSPIEHVWDQLKRQMPLCHSVHDLEVAVQDVWVHLPQDNIRRLSTQCRNVLRHVLQQEVVRRAIEVALYLSNCTHCICLIVLIFGSSEYLSCFIVCIKFHFNPVLPSWCAIFNVPVCIIRNEQRRTEWSQETVQESTVRRSIRNEADNRRRPKRLCIRNDVEEHNCGTMSEQCGFCGAVYWKEEKNTAHKYTKCCHNGKVQLPAFPDAPELLKALLT
ncbi:hypothetical protein AVEN_256993-1 [Araneus ventricosus]|uniref:Tc1-like transposase DDE domain-containing protein n=1 Tax=Araneus ventricosus TaxID=182803 RepID=A0A4Y2X126_ARAVE|nr:hypothetical protein AVEN_141295-1 [Araneus ventricosus]GBO43231.1 hypothetical protein AVEN_256993-1 [Araneus ventricosus]